MTASGAVTAMVTFTPFAVEFFLIVTSGLRLHLGGEMQKREEKWQ